MRTLVIAAFATALLAAAPASAAPCKDAKGKFIKCVAKPKGPCKDAKGRFIKCA